MTPIFKLNESTGMLEEQPGMEEPNEFNYKGQKSNFRFQEDMLAYNRHLESLRKLTILPEHKEHFKAGVEYVEGKDVKVEHRTVPPVFETEGEYNEAVYESQRELPNRPKPKPVAIPTTERRQGEFVEDLYKQVRDHIKADNLYDWDEAMSNEEMTYLENLLLTFGPVWPRGSIGESRQPIFKAYQKQAAELQQLREENERLKGELDRQKFNDWCTVNGWVFYEGHFTQAHPNGSVTITDQNALYKEYLSSTPSPDARRVAVDVLDWVLQKSADGLLVMCDGNFYHESDKEGDQALEPKDIIEWATKENWKSLNPSTGDKRSLTDLTDAECLEGTKILGIGGRNIYDESIIYQFRELMKGIYNQQTNIPGMKWFKLCKYFESIGVNPLKNDQS